MNKLDAWMAFSRWQSSDHTDYAAAAMLSRIVGWDVAAHYAEPDTDPWFWDGEIERAVEDRYGLLELQNPPRDLGKWHLGMRVSVYWNLHTFRWSVRSNKTGRVVAHGQSVYLVAPRTKALPLVRFRVRDSGRLQAIAEGKKNVHAVVVGELAGIDTPPPAGVAGWSGVTYNPFRDVSFIDRDTRQPVRAAERAYFDIKDDGLPRLRADGAIDVPVRANGGDATGQWERVYATDAPEFGIGGGLLDPEAAKVLSHTLSVRPVLSYTSDVPNRPTGWEWMWSPETHPVSEGFAATRGDAIRDALDVITARPGYTQDSPLGNLVAGLRADLDLDERLAHLIKNDLAKTATDPDDLTSYDELLNLVVGGLNAGGSKVPTSAIKRVLTAMEKNSDAVHELLSSAIPAPDPRGFLPSFPVGSVLLKGWTVGPDGFVPPFNADPAVVGETWRELRANRIAQRSLAAGTGVVSLLDPARYDEIVKKPSFKVGTIVFLYAKDGTRPELMPATAIRLSDGWHEINTPRGSWAEKHTDGAMLEIMRRGSLAGHGGSRDHTSWIVFVARPNPEFTRNMQDSTQKLNRKRAVYARLREVSLFLPGFSHWAPVLYATRGEEEAAEIRSRGIPSVPDNDPKWRAYRKLKSAQTSELKDRARRRYIAARLGIGGQLPVRRNYVQVVLAVIGMVLPIIIEQLGTSVADFNRAPRIERQRKLIAILSSRLWWLSANPVTVMAARQVAASEKLQNAVLDLLEKHGNEAVAVAGDAAQAALQGEVSRRAATVAGET
jgi:hypothetical protein